MPIITETTDAPGITAAGIRPTSSPYRMALGDTFNGNLNTFNDSDWVSVSMEAGYGYVITLSPAPASGMRGAYLSLWNSQTTDLNAEVYTYTQALETTRLAIGVNPAELTGTFLEEGEYFIEVRGNGRPTGNGQYAINFSREVGNDRFTEATADLGVAFNSRIDYAAYQRQFASAPGDVDVVAFDLNAGQTYIVTVTGIDTNIEIQDAISSTSLLGSSTGDGDGRTTVTFTPTETGRFLAVIEAANSSAVGDYTLLLSEPGRLLTGTPERDGLVGGAGNDTIFGLDGNDVISGGAGDDSIDGGLGHDRILAREGADTVIGGGGNDTILGGSSETDLRDVIYGGDGNDTIDGGYGNDELRGDAGNDTIEGGFGADTVIGGDGEDVLTGSAYGDAITGGAGNDFINGGFGFDRVNGGAGADKFYHLGVRDHGSDWIQDYTAADGDVLLFGGPANTSASDFLIQRANTPNAGTAGTQEVFVTQISTGNLLWALVDGDAQAQINIQIGGQVFDLLA